MTSGALVIWGACTVRARAAVWLRLPDVPVNVTLAAFVADAESNAVSVVLCGVPGVTVNVAGVAVTPAGRPAIATTTVPLKALTAVAVTLTWDPAPPDERVSVVGEMVRL